MADKKLISKMVYKKYPRQTRVTSEIYAKFSREENAVLYVANQTIKDMMINNLLISEEHSEKIRLAKHIQDDLDDLKETVIYSDSIGPDDLSVLMIHCLAEDIELCAYESCDV